MTYEPTEIVEVAIADGEWIPTKIHLRGKTGYATIPADITRKLGLQHGQQIVIAIRKEETTE